MFDHVAGEVEAAQVAAQVLLAAGLLGVRAQLFGQADHVLERVVARAQHVQLLLGKVANVQALALGHVTGQRLHGAGNGFDQGGFTLAVGAQNTNALARQHRAVDAGENGGGVALVVGIAK